MRALVLGVTGMLGSMVYDYLSRNHAIVVAGSSRPQHPRSTSPAENIFALDAEREDIDSQLATILRAFKPDFLINCIGIINVHCRDDDAAGVLRAVRVNALFPHLLAQTLRHDASLTKVLHITTDCVFSGRAGDYDESALHDPVDMYGKSKSLGEVRTESWINIRCSIIGPERHGRQSLLQWFLGHPDNATINGYAHHMWNGVTTLQYAQLCEELIIQGGFEQRRALNHTLHYVCNESVAKYDLLQLLATVYGRDYHIERVTTPGPPVDRTLNSIYLNLARRPMRDAIQELKDYCERVAF